MAHFGKMLFVFVITMILFVVGGIIVFNFLQSNTWTIVIIGWAIVVALFSLYYLNSDQPKFPYYLGLVVALVLILIKRGLLQI